MPNSGPPARRGRRSGPTAPPAQRLQAPPTPGTLAAWLLDTTARFAEAGLTSPRTDAQRLAALALGTTWSGLWTRLRDKLSASQLDSLEELASRRAGGEPLAYITKSTSFCGVEIKVGPGVLVPRPETETLAEVALELIAQTSNPVVVDVGTGSGCIAAFIAHERDDAAVHATDISQDALLYAEENAPGVTFHLGYLLDPLPLALGSCIDLIVSNPPYIPAGREDMLPPDVRAEPREALFAGPDGDELLKELVRTAPEWLRSGGALAVEVGTPEQATLVLDLLGGWADRGVRDDRTGRPRVVWARHA